MGNAFHETAIAHEGIGVVVDDVVAVAIELRSQQRFAERHADRIGNALAQWPGRGLHPRRDADLRVARRARMQLTELLEFFDGQVVAGEMQQGIDQHRAMTVRQDEAVAVGPGGVRRIVPQMARP